MRQVIIYPGEDGYWVAECASLPGCISQGETREEAIANIKEAVEVYAEALEEDGLPIPRTLLRPQDYLRKRSFS
jgi:predicted RNase H-like HicB family nuclease